MIKLARRDYRMIELRNSVIIELKGTYPLGR